jgi:uncharacterized protein (TIGR01777 family)
VLIRALEKTYGKKGMGQGDIEELCDFVLSFFGYDDYVLDNFLSAPAGVVLGPGGGSLSVQLPLFRAGLGGRLGSGRQWMSFISLEDEVAAILHVLGNDTISGPVNLTAPAPVRNADFTRTLALVVAKPGRLAVPRFAMRGLLGADLAEEMLLASQRVLPRVLTDTGFVFALAGLRETLEVATRRG